MALTEAWKRPEVGPSGPSAESTEADRRRILSARGPKLRTRRYSNFGTCSREVVQLDLPPPVAGHLRRRRSIIDPMSRQGAGMIGAG
jgi:hypothetical protein